MSLSNHLSVYPVGNDPHQWDILQSQCSFLNEWGIDVLRDGLRGEVGTVLLEPRYYCKDHRNLFSNFYSRKTNPGSHECARLHFFTDPNLTVRKFQIGSEDEEAGYLGYSIIRPVAKRCLGRTVIDPSVLGWSRNERCSVLSTAFRVRLGGRVLTVHGYPYLSQDTDVTVCAHAALWGVCRYLSERHSAHADLLPYDFIKLTTPTVGRVAPYRGMTYQDYSKILSDFGRHPVVIRTKQGMHDQLIDQTALREIYSYVASGLPVLASFGGPVGTGGGHVVTLVGHTLDHRRKPTVDELGLVDSSRFLDHFIVVDDNRFPYRRLGYPGDPKNYKSEYNIDRIVTGVCPLPEKLYLPASKARDLARTLLEPYLKDFPRADFGVTKVNEPIVTRLFAASGPSWKRHKLLSGLASDGICNDRINLHVTEFYLPNFVWVMEVSAFSLYRKELCAAEIVLDATANETERSALLYARVGATLIWDGKRQTLLDHPKTFKQFAHTLGEL